MKRILVATDGSDCSQRAVREAKKIAECMDSKVEIINVIPKRLMPTLQGVSSKEQVDKILAEYKLENEYYEVLSKTLLDEALKIFEGFQGDVTTKNIVGDPAREIIKEAEEGNYDLIVMGCRGQGFFDTMIGSTTNKVLSNTDKKVLTV